MPDPIFAASTTAIVQMLGGRTPVTYFPSGSPGTSFSVSAIRHDPRTEEREVSGIRAEFLVDGSDLRFVDPPANTDLIVTAEGYTYVVDNVEANGANGYLLQARQKAAPMGVSTWR